ncbi:type II secretion system F family protein [Kutzneria kofuensis]|uniref:Tight adherence protein B n=1 Tax=Kutzneria kofuensis TaxID=103725 RepID=A0A7W9KHH8_9PSEU|nr:type II secretion system F family protein [Kutzneria kofuensis]MBB5892338.1 tight adherence protein B [Kutzneria kofuensis]
MSISVALLAVAVLVWPVRHAQRRLRALMPVERQPKRRWRLPRPTNAVLAVVGAGVGWCVLGPGGAVANAVLCVTCWRRWHSRRSRRRRTQVAEGMVGALGALVAELRVGAHPATAAERAAMDADPLAAKAMSAVAKTARLGGDVDRALVRSAADEPSLAGVLGQVGRAWRLAGRHGVPLAEVLDSVRRDLDQRLQFSRQVHARMAGPRASAAVLAVLPELGVLLGEAIDARPLHVLADTPIGQVLLATGALLICGGVLWSAKLTDHAVMP